MAIDITMEVTGIGELFRKLDSISANEILRKPMEACLIDLQSYMADDYPGPPQRPYPNMLWTAKQRRYFFWALKKGLITVPYVRTGKLGQGWSWKVSTEANGLHGTVGNNLGYAPYVQSKAKQALIHYGNWRTDAQAVEEKRDEIVRRFRDAIAAALAK